MIYVTILNMKTLSVFFSAIFGDDFLSLIPHVTNLSVQNHIDAIESDSSFLRFIIVYFFREHIPSPKCMFPLHLGVDGLISQIMLEIIGFTSVIIPIF